MNLLLKYFVFYLFVFYGCTLNPYYERSKYTTCHNLNDKVLEHKTIKGMSIIKLASGKEIIFMALENFNYTKNDIDDFIEIGDTIIKKKCGDSIYIKKENINYGWIISDAFDEDVCSICE